MLNLAQYNFSPIIPLFWQQNSTISNLQVEIIKLSKYILQVSVPYLINK